MRLWLGVLGAPLAWAAQHVTGYALTEAECGGARLGVPMDALTIAVTAVAAAVAVAAGLSALATWRSVQGDHHEPPPDGRVTFLAVMGMTLTPLFLMIILMSGLGAVFLTECVQS